MADADENSKGPMPARDGINVLLLEDDPILAKYFGKALLQKGLKEVFICHTNESAIKISKEQKIHIAFLDVKLKIENSLETAEFLSGMKIPFTFLSGALSSSDVQSRFPGAGHLTKPARSDQLESAIDRMIAAVPR